MINHPTGLAPHSINLVALGPTNADYQAAHFKYDPVLPPMEETWTVNKGFRTIANGRGKPVDLVFILDDLVGEARISERYRQDINGCGIPIITSIIDPDVKEKYPDANLWVYPIQEIVDFYGRRWLSQQGMKEANAQQIRNAGLRVASYLKNSIPMMLAYAGAIGVREINLFGADYDFPGHAIHEADKPNTEYWIGALIHGLGIKLGLTDRTTLLSTHLGRDIYGYGARQPIL